MLNFPNQKKFIEWKKKEELRNFLYYSKQRGDGESEIIIHTYFVCQHDGHAKVHRKKAEPARKTGRKFRRGQVKSNRFCPSTMTCHINKATNAVCVEYISAHSHPVNLANTVCQPISSTIRQEIKAKLSIGVPVNEVYKELREGMGNRESRAENLSITREHLISKANVSDIKRHMKYSRRLHREDSNSIHLIVKKLQPQSYNSIIVYKPVQTSPSMYDDIDVKKTYLYLEFKPKNN